MNTRVVQISTENAAFQILETLQRNRNKRNRLQEFLVEGVRSLTQAVQNHWDVHALVYSPQQRLSSWAKDIMVQAQAPIHYELTPALLEKLSQKEDTSELMAVIAMKADRLERIPSEEPLTIVVFDRPVHPGNLGTLIRTCDALGANGLVVSGHAVDLYDPETIRATTGSFFALPVVRQPSSQELLPWFDSIREQHPRLQIIGTSARATLPLYEQDFTRPTILLIGNENHGLSQAYKAICDALVTIPQSGSASSMNAACAASIFLYEIKRQRGM